MAFAQTVFIQSGLLYLFTSWYFYSFKSQATYFLVLILMMVFSIAFILIWAPESPQYLFESENFEELKACFQQIQRFNRNYDA